MYPSPVTEAPQCSQIKSSFFLVNRACSITGYLLALSINFASAKLSRTPVAEGRARSARRKPQVSETGVGGSCAGRGNRTPVLALGRPHTATILHPQTKFLQNKIDYSFLKSKRFFTHCHQLSSASSSSPTFASGSTRITVFSPGFET